MAIIKSETWDGVTAPAIPAGWTVDGQLVTATTNSPTSAPNALVHPPASTNNAIVPTATWATLDTAAGNVRVSATLRFANTGAGASDQDCWVFARSAGVASAANFGTTSYYQAGIWRNGATPGLRLGKIVSGSATTLAIVGAAAFADAANYRVALRCVGSAISVTCQRLSDSFWLNSAGTFVSDPTNATVAISVTDTSLAASAGYSGAAFYMGNTAGGAVGLDDWLLESTADTQTVAISDSHLFFSPYTWRLSGSAYAQTTTPGAYLKVGFSGTSCALAVDVTPLSGASVSAGSYPWVRYSVDNGAWTDAQLTSATTQLSTASGLSAGNHTLEAYLLSATETVDRWTPVNVLRVSGIVIDAAEALLTPSGTIAVAAKRLLCYGDSITEGLHQESGSDSTTSYVRALAAALGAEVGAVGFGGLGWAIDGSGSVPMLYNATDSLQSWNKYSSGQSRLASGVLSPLPDYIVVVLGTNDGLNSISDGAVQSAVSGWLGAVRAAASGVPLFVCVPPGGYKRTPITAAVAAQNDPKVYLIDLGTAAQAGLSGPQGTPSQQSVDSIHPRSAVQGRLGAALAEQIVRALAPGGGARRVNLSGGIAG